MESLVVYGMLSYFAILTLRGQGTRTVSVGGSVVLVVLIGFSRLYLGAHYLSAVVGGFATGRVAERRHHGLGGDAPA
jgi:membrane-associated phospholipid phosphatase